MTASDCKIATSSLVLNLAFCIFIVFSFQACNSGGGSSDSLERSSERGSIAFKLALESSSRSLMIGQLATDFECVTESHEIDVIEAEVRDENDELLASSQPFPCEDRRGTITGVKAGDSRVVVIFARDVSGNILFSGESEPGPVKAGQVNDFGTIMLNPVLGATVEGVVKDGVTDSPLGDVAIDMLRGGASDFAGLTDSIGFYSIDVTPGRGYTVEFSKAGFLPETYHDVSVEAGSVTVLETVP